jgi:lysophospholipid hydrolase
LVNIVLILHSMIIVVALISAAGWVVRYRYLNMYSRLPPEPQRKEPDIDLFPDTHEEDAKAGLSSYLDEFLSAIKIFGYLERSVFHELTRSMQTRKLIAGETLNLEEEQGFCLVVDGLVEIFVKSARDTRNPAFTTPAGAGVDSSPDSEEDYFSPGHGQQQYQLLTEVRNGAPMSSLFSIMSLFTEDVQLHHTDYDGSDQALVRTTKPMHNRNTASADFRKQHGMPVSFSDTPQMGAESGSPEADAIEANGGIPPMSLDPPTGARPPPRRPVPKRMGTNSAHPDIIARATVDTTIAIIPASAFRRLIKIYPKATSHIVHVILSRFQRVTLATAFSYLGLTGEVLQTEKNIVKYTMCQLPNDLRGDALERLKEKFQRERDRIGEEDVGKGIALHNSRTGQRRRSSTALRKEAALQAFNKQRPSTHVASTMASPQVRGSMDTPSPGDLLTNANMRPTGDARSPTYLGISPTDPGGMESVSPLAQRTFNPFATQRNLGSKGEKREAVDEDNLFRESILDCMFKSIGLTSTSTGGSMREPDSAQPSPRLFSHDQRRQKAGLGSNAFGFMDPFEGSVDGDTESITSGMSMQPGANINLLAHDMKDEVDIVFFPKGSVLVEQGERNPGLYYVIDGFVDICTTVEDSSPEILHSSRKSSSGSSSYGGPATSKPRAPSTSRFSIPEMGGGPADGKKKRMRRQSVALIKPGGLAGYVGTISSYRSFIDVVAKTDVYVGFLPRASIERIVDRYPIVLLTMAKRLTNLLPRLILHIDFALEWLQVNAGQVLFHGGEESEAIYIVLNGRLRLVEDKPDGGVSAKAEFGQGESVGELEVLTESARSGTLHAIRDTELVKFPRTLFNSLAQEHPNITIKISKIIASRMRNLVNGPAVSLSNQGGVRTSGNKGSSTLNLRTVAVLPVTAGVPVVEFGNRLMSALSQVGTPNGATSLNQSAILNHLGRHAFNKMGKLKLAQYLADLEEKYGLVIYVAGKPPMPLFKQ